MTGFLIESLGEHCGGFWVSYGVDCHLLSAAKSLYSCSEVCSSWRVKSQLFAMGVGLWQGCMLLSPPIFYTISTA